MNNFYVDEMPDCCGNCSLCCKDDLGYWCQATRLVYIDERFVAEKRLNSCPLKPLSDRLAEERKKVVQEIKDLAGDYFEMPYCDACGNTDFNDVVLTGNDLTEILDDVERGE